METSTVSQLPTFAVRRVTALGHHWAEVTCPRADCGSVHLVSEGAWREKHAERLEGCGTRPCPYCFRVSWIPEEWAPTPRRVVRRRKV